MFCREASHSLEQHGAEGRTLERIFITHDTPRPHRAVTLARQRHGTSIDVRDQPPLNNDASARSRMPLREQQHAFVAVRGMDVELEALREASGRGSLAHGRGLLMIALGLASGAWQRASGLGGAMQVVAGSGRRQRGDRVVALETHAHPARSLPARENRDVNLDIGETVQVLNGRPTAPRAWCIADRVDSAIEVRLPPSLGSHQVIAVEGNWLVVAPPRPRTLRHLDHRTDSAIGVVGRPFHSVRRAPHGIRHRLRGHRDHLHRPHLQVRAAEPPESWNVSASYNRRGTPASTSSCLSSTASPRTAR